MKLDYQIILILLICLFQEMVIGDRGQNLHNAANRVVVVNKFEHVRVTIQLQKQVGLIA